MILIDRALRGLALIRTKSPAEAEGIPGIGPVKLHAVVPRFPEAIAKRERNGVESCRLHSSGTSDGQWAKKVQKNNSRLEKTTGLCYISLLLRLIGGSHDDFIPRQQFDC